MKITSSTVSMESERKYVGYSYASSKTTVAQAIPTAGKVVKAAQPDRQDTAQFSASQTDKPAASDSDEIDDEKSLKQYKLEIMLKMLKALARSRSGERANCTFRRVSGCSGMDSAEYVKKLEQAVSPISFTAVSNGSAPAVTSAAPQTRWVQTTVNSAFIAETENTAFQATGVAKTADGRELSFNVTLEMSRAFVAQYSEISTQNYITTDPLVINLNTATASVSDQKFLFDLDSDGTQDEISFTGSGSGFLALDKNGDGLVNNGSELFGTKSGNGFADLAVYDSDGNSWIDEADAIFSKLKVWTKDVKGNSILMSLKDADVGAIYLSSAATEFSLNNTVTNQTNGVIRSTGIYLKESGGTGTVQHVDLTL